MKLEQIRMRLKRSRQLIFGQDIFISHRWDDKSRAYSLKLAEELEKRGLDCFIDYNNIRGGSSKYRVIHIATHYVFQPTQMQDSFLLVGDGRLTFGEMMEKDKSLFGAVDLLTLSACDTGKSGNGKEAEGFSIKAQGLGAKAVLASLWKVSDAGTLELMIRFYKLLAENPQMSKGIALRNAQLSLLYGNVKPEDRSLELLKKEKSAEQESKKLNLPLAVQDEQKPFAHPFYWASFVLTGNWR
jgi:CHAT domain-containing protein